ncbi:MAG: hypothetical protein M9894_24745 [Planctomycetes bacterium]|nr:hypothetical protein [Planctomycetota bacterium]
MLERRARSERRAAETVRALGLGDDDPAAEAVRIYAGLDSPFARRGRAEALDDLLLGR